MCSTNAFQEALKNFLILEPAAVTLKSGCVYEPVRDLFRLDYLAGPTK